MKCPYCNAENEDGAKSCKSCGEPFETEDIIETPGDRNARLEEIQARRLKKRQRQKRNKIIIICLIATAVIVGASFGVYWMRDAFIDRTATGDTPTTIIGATPSTSPTPYAPTPLPTEEATAEPIVSETPEPASGWQTTQPSEAASGANQSASAASGAGNSQPSTSTSKPQAAAPSKTAAPKASSATKAPVTKQTTKPVISSPGFTASTIAPSEVPQGQSMTAQLITMTGYVTVPSTGEQLLSFKIGNSVYFSYIPFEPLENGVQNAYYSVDAKATTAVFYGLPVYKLSNVVSYSVDNYILPNSATVQLTENDLSGLSKSELKLARNEIFARHGRAFKKQELQNYFNSKSWYKLNPKYNYTNDYMNLSALEKANAKFILAYENR